MIKEQMGNSEYFGRKTAGPIQNLIKSIGGFAENSLWKKITMLHSQQFHSCQA